MSELTGALIARIQGIEDRLAHLETLEYAALAGALWVRGANGGVRTVYIPRKDVADGVATAVFSVTTTDEAGDNDAGHYAVWVLALASQGDSVTAARTASMSAQYMWTRSQRDTGEGVTSAVLEIAQTAGAATLPAFREIGGIALATTEVSEYVVNVEFTVSAIGTNKLQLGVSCWVVLDYHLYTTPPVITAL